MRHFRQFDRAGWTSVLLAGVMWLAAASAASAASLFDSLFQPPCHAPPAYPPPAATLPPPGAPSVLDAPPLAGGACDGFCDPAAGCCPRDLFALTDGPGGVIDNAVLRDRLRVRYDHFKGVDAPERAEYLFGARQSLDGPAGEPLSNLQYQELTTYVEWKFHPQLSLFGELPIRFVDNGIGQLDIQFENFQTHNAGAGDVEAGLRYALLQRPRSYVTAQLKIYAPTGDVSRFLGTGHSAIEAGVLLQHQWDRLTVFGELLDWQASGATTLAEGFDDDLTGQRFGGNVLRYGIGAAYDLGRRIDHQRLSRLAFVCELIGWTVLDGLRADREWVAVPDEPDQLVIVPADAAGDTILNFVFGFRYTVGCNTFYIGYGTDWTDRRWYSDQFRLEVGHNF